MKDVSDGVTRNRVRTNVCVVRLLGRYFHQVQQIVLLATLLILMLPGMAAACAYMSWIEFSPGIAGFLFFIEAVFFWLFAAKFLKCRINFWWILLVTFFANVASTFVSVVITFNVLYRILAENLLIIGLTFVIIVLIEWCVYLLVFYRKIPGFTRLLKISFGANTISFILIAVAYVIYLANPPSYTYSRDVQMELQNVMAAQASYFSEHNTFTSSIEELIAEEDLTINEDVIVQVVYADKESFKAVAYHRKGNTGYKITSPAGNFDRIPTEDAVKLIEAAVERKKAVAAGLEDDDTVEGKNTNTPDTKTEPQKKRKKKETVSIVGTWTLWVPGSDCLESIIFSSDNIFKIVSGQEIQKGFYAYQKTVKTGKRHKLETMFKYDNGLPDCSGREDIIIHQKITRYLEFDYDGSAFTLYPKPSGSDALVGLYRKIK